VRILHARPIAVDVLRYLALFVVCMVCGLASPVVAQNPPAGGPLFGGNGAPCVSGGGSVTWPENTTGHNGAFTVRSCGTAFASWTLTCTATGSVACNSTSASCYGGLPGRSCSTTVTYSVGAVGSGTVTLTAQENDNGNHSSWQTPVTVQAGPPEIAVTTYHYDTYRTGWNQHEQTLTPTNVVPGSFGLLYTISLDDQVDAQPLFTPHVVVNTGPYAGTTHDIVYVATENNTIYAIEPATGTVLFSRHLEAPNPNALGCPDGPPNIGITGTPVIDSASNTLYVINQAAVSPNPYHLRALDLGTLNDKVYAPSGLNVFTNRYLPDGTPFGFQPHYQRQRAALLEANGNIYAAFGSFCDWGGFYSRGWLLGWHAGSLDSLGPHYNQLNDLQNPIPAPPTFLSSIWMSGYGPAADSSGNLYFVTGNTHGGYHDPSYNISESAVKVSPNLSGPPLNVFTTPSVNALDSGDRDFGAGGIMLVPDGTRPAGYLLAVAAGKEDTMYLLNRNPGYLSNICSVYANCPYRVGSCWCGPSFFNGQIVSSGGAKVMLWNVGADITNVPVLTQAAQATLPTNSSGDNQGFFTSVSSNGTQAGTGIIWAVTRPLSGNLSLYALNATNLSTLFSEAATPQPAKISYIMPVVANGLVFVAAASQLSIFGLGGH
jgi:hypothetical protein